MNTSAARETEVGESSHLHAVSTPRSKTKFAALDHDVALALGRQRGASVLYGVLATAWFEFADPARSVERKKKIRPGDWVEVDYRTFMAVAGTNARDSVARWIRVLTEGRHSCPWHQCSDLHPLVVMERQGQNRPNRYRKWRCNEDVPVVATRVKSQRLKEIALERVREGRILNSARTRSSSGVSDDAALASRPAHPSDFQKTDDQTSDLGQPNVVSADFRKSGDQNPSAPTIRLPEVCSSDHVKTEKQTSLHEKHSKLDYVVNNSQTTATHTAADFEQADEVDAVACEVVDSIMALAAPREPEYSEDRAWSVARRLVSAILRDEPSPATARELLLRAITDRRLVRAANPIGLLIRGVLGTTEGTDRFLLARSPIHRTTVQPASAPIQSQAEVVGSSFIHSNQLALDDPTAYRTHLEEILKTIELPFEDARRLDHPMALGICRSRLEQLLRSQSGCDSVGKSVNQTSHSRTL